MISLPVACEFRNSTLPLDRYEHAYDRFELAGQFDITRFHDALSDSPTHSLRTPEGQPKEEDTEEDEDEDAVVMPGEDEWGLWNRWTER